MRTTTALENVIDSVSDMSRNNYDQSVPLQDMEFESLSNLVVDGQSFSVLDQAQRLISNRLHVPHSYLVRCPQDLQKENLNYWLGRERSQRDSFFVRFNGNQISNRLRISVQIRPASMVLPKPTSSAINSPLLGASKKLMTGLN